jgi:hypothetical protein
LPVGAAVAAINEVFKAGTMSEVRKYQRSFFHLRHGIALARVMINAPFEPAHRNDRQTAAIMRLFFAQTS